MQTFKKGEKIGKYVINSFIKKGPVAESYTVLGPDDMMYFMKIYELQRIPHEQLFELRQTGDYDDWKVVTENDVKPLIPTAELFLDTLEKHIRENGYLD